MIWLSSSPVRNTRISTEQLLLSIFSVQLMTKKVDMHLNHTFTASRHSKIRKISQLSRNSYTLDVGKCFSDQIVLRILRVQKNVLIVQVEFFLLLLLSRLSQTGGWTIQLLIGGKIFLEKVFPRMKRYNVSRIFSRIMEKLFMENQKQKERSFSKTLLLLSLWHIILPFLISLLSRCGQGKRSDGV